MFTGNRVVCAAVLAAVYLSGCARKDTTKASTDSVQAAGGEVASLKVSSIDVGKAIGGDKMVTSPTANFAPRDTIYVSVATEGTGTATLEARWMYQDGQVVDESTHSITANGPEHTEFHVAKPTAWPAGKYKVEIS